MRTAARALLCVYLRGLGLAKRAQRRADAAHAAEAAERELCEGRLAQLEERHAALIEQSAQSLASAQADKDGVQASL